MSNLSNEYNGLIHTFVSEPLLNNTWANLAKDKNGTTPVTLGTDSWFPTAIAAEIDRRPFYNRLGAGTQADMTVYFYKNDRVYINDLILYCNFADGLVKDSNVAVTPAPFTLPASGIQNYELEAEMKVRLTNYKLQADNTIVSAGTLDFPVPHFNQVNQLASWLPNNLSLLAQTDKCQWFEIELIRDNPALGNLPSYSTLNINTAFQSTRALIWAEATLSHTFGTCDADDVTAGTTGWPD